MLETIKAKKKELELRFNKVQEVVVKMEKDMLAHKEELAKLQGSYRVLDEMEAEIMANTEVPKVEAEIVEPTV